MDLTKIKYKTRLLTEEQIALSSYIILAYRKEILGKIIKLIKEDIGLQDKNIQDYLWATIDEIKKSLLYT